ncbi:hypothetical protein WMF31_14110 [Sorangium sp. So ce1036]|uniref:hypothetical protein n=1 Tax=Sorangium sp. So ce1036 TaxID=3133328 RepID=UPI003F08C3C3
MKCVARILTVCALAAGACLSPSQASAEDTLLVQDHFIPRLGASVYSNPVIYGDGVVISYLHPNSPLRRMYSDYLGYFHADPGDVILMANGARIRDVHQLARIIHDLQGVLYITVRDTKTGKILSGRTQL